MAYDLRDIDSILDDIRAESDAEEVAHRDDPPDEAPCGNRRNHMWLRNGAPCPECDL